jgi:hypothetical protein
MALDSVEWSTSIPGHFTLRDDPTVTMGYGGWVGLRTSLDVLGREKSLASARDQTLYYPAHSPDTVLTGTFG